MRFFVHAVAFSWGGVLLADPAMADCRTRTNPFDYCRGEIVITPAKRIGTVITLPDRGRVLIEINKQANAQAFPVSRLRTGVSNLATLRGCVANDTSFCVGTRVATPEDTIEYIVAVFERDEVYTGPSAQIDVMSSRIQRQLTRRFTADLRRD